MNRTEAALKALKHPKDEHLYESDVSEDLRQSEFIKTETLESISCPSCGETAEQADNQYICQNNPGHRWELSSEKVETKRATFLSQKALKHLLEEDYDVQEENNFFWIRENKSLIIMVPGPYKERSLKELFVNFLPEQTSAKDILIITFSEEARQAIEKQEALLRHHISVLNGSENLQWNIDEFLSKSEHLSSIREELNWVEDAHFDEEVVELWKENRLSQELQRSYKVDPHYNAYRAFEQLVSAAMVKLSHASPCIGLGESSKSRVPDSIGLVGAGENQSLLLVDAKSVSSDEREYPDMNEKDSPTQGTYISKGQHLAQQEGIGEVILLFVAPSFNETKTKNFVDSVHQYLSDSQVNFHIRFLRVSALVMLLQLQLNPSMQKHLDQAVMSWPELVRYIFTEVHSDANPKFVQKNSAYLKPKNMRELVPEYQKDISHALKRAEQLATSMENLEGDNLS